jgi:hypothetical protein
VLLTSYRGKPSIGFQISMWFNSVVEDIDRLANLASPVKGRG